MSKKIGLVAFFLLWSQRMRWDVPDIHIRALHWLENRGDLAVLRCFRGFGKSTLLAIYNAWRLYNDPTFRILHQSESDPTAYKTSRDTKNVLMNHPLTKGMIKAGEVESWWVHGSTDARNANFYAKGILSNVTSARADECQNDDPEVPRNIQTPEAREKLRYRLGEQTHILVPGGKKLYIGTPHTHDSLYDQIEALGADCLTIRMFAKEHRFESANERRYELTFLPEFVFAGIGENARLLSEGKDYQVSGVAGRGYSLTFAKPPGCLVDCYAGSAWPERFTREELQKRRKETRTINEFDSQYQLHSKPIHESRLDPERLKPYDIEPILTRANGELRMMVGSMQIVSARMYWDCALGKVKADASAVSIFLEDDRGNYYWHRCEAMLGEYAEFNDDRNGHITGGQVLQVCALIRQFQIPTIYVENNGVGAFTPQLLRKALKQERLQCGVREVTVTSRKNDRILEGLEGPMRSGVLWAHTSVLDGPLWDQMKDWNPEITNQPDDYLDSGAGAILQAPVRIGKAIGELDRIMPGHVTQDWRPNAGVAEAAFEY